MRILRKGNFVKFRKGSRLRLSYTVGSDEVGCVTDVVDDGTAIARVNVKSGSCELKGVMTAEFVLADAPAEHPTGSIPIDELNASKGD
jgi:hypothetical protein